MENKERKICRRCGHALSECHCEKLQPMKGPLRIVVLQHPQEKKKPMNSAWILEDGLKNAEVKVGLSWASFKKAIPYGTEPSRWAVLYAGTRTAFQNLKMDPKRAYTLVNKNKKPVKLQDLEGIVILDGTWQQSKALWWRNPWLLKLNRLVLNPANLSLRSQVRDYYMSTAEAVAHVMALMHRGDIHDLLMDLFRQHVETVGRRPKGTPASSLPFPKQ